MCMMALGLVAGIAQAAVGYAQAKQQADEQNKYFEQNRQASLAAMRDRYASTNNNTLQERESSVQEAMTKQVEAIQARAKARAAAGEGGVTGLSVDALLGDYEAQQARQLEAIQTNFKNKKERNEDEQTATLHNTIGRINSVRQASKPSAAGFILQGIGGALGSMR